MRRSTSSSPIGNSAHIRHRKQAVAQVEAVVRTKAVRDSRAGKPGDIVHPAACSDLSPCRGRAAWAAARRAAVGALAEAEVVEAEVVAADQAAADLVKVAVVVVKAVVAVAALAVPVGAEAVGAEVAQARAA